MPIGRLPIVMSLAAVAAAAAAAQSPPPPPQMDLERREMRVEVRMTDQGPPEIVVNGEAIPPERLRRLADGGFEILDRPDGEVVHVIPRIWEGPRRAVDAGAPEPGAGAGPRPMVGVVMARVEPLLARHLRLDPDRAIFIEGVMEGSPAMEAGLVAGDIVVGIAGGPATPERMAQAVELAGVERRIGLEVIHEGERRRVEIAPRLMSPPRPRMPGEMRPEIRVEVDRGGRERPDGERPRRPRGGMRAPAPHPGGDEAEWMHEIEGLVEVLAEEIEIRAEAFREHLDGPWMEDHIHRPMSEFRDQAEHVYDDLMRHVEQLEREMQHRLEEQMREMERHWGEWRREIERRLDERLRERTEMERDRERRRDEPQRDRGRDRDRRGGSRPA